MEILNTILLARQNNLKTPEIHGLPLAHCVGGPQGYHDDCEQRVNHEVDPVRGIAATASLVHQALVHLCQQGNQDGGDHQHQGQGAPCK